MLTTLFNFTLQKQHEKRKHSSCLTTQSCSCTCCNNMFICMKPCDPSASCHMSKSNNNLTLRIYAKRESSFTKISIYYRVMFLFKSQYFLFTDDYVCNYVKKKKERAIKYKILLFSFNSVPQQLQGFWWWEILWLLHINFKKINTTS